ncbi:MAG: AAA family ATPase [Promethearchaeota archaeon]
MKSSFLVEPVLAGREDELGKLQISLDSALKGKGKTIFIYGEAGIGKTRLINEFLKLVKKKEITILSGWCLSNAELPYFPFIEAFRIGLSSREVAAIDSQRASLRSWLSETYTTEKLEKTKTVSPQVWKDQAFASVTRELLFMSSMKPLILVLEDMHWADSASLALLHYISRAIVDEKILVLVTFRSKELSNDTNGHPHPLVETIQLMGREGLFKEIKLTNLDKDEVRAIAGNMLGGKVNPELITRLFEESRGNPLFVVEFLRMLSEQGNLVREQNQWRLLVDKLGMPSKVKEVIQRRISTLKPDQRRVLDVASVIGDKFNPDLIGAVLSKDSLEILELLNEILNSTSLVRVEENLFRFDHAKFQEVLYEKISLPLKRGYHSRIAEQIEKAWKAGKDVLLSDLAHHYVQAGNREKSVKYSLAAGQDALARFSNTEAIKYFKYVLESVTELNGFSVERNVALEGLGDAYYANCMFEEAIKTFENLAKSEITAVSLRAYRKEMEALWYKDQNPFRLMKLVKKAEKFVTPNRLEKARIRWNKGRALTWLGDFKGALREHEEALKIFEEEYSLPDIAHVLLGTGFSRLMTKNNPEKGISEILRSVALYHHLGDSRGELITTINGNHGFSLIGLGDYKRRVTNYYELLKLATKIGDFENAAESAFALGIRLQEAENIEESKKYLMKALEYTSTTDAKGLESRIYAFLINLYSRLGDLEQSEYYFNSFNKIPKQILKHPKNHFWIVLAKAVLLATKKQWKDSSKNFEKMRKMLMTKFYNHAVYELGWRINYAWALQNQGYTIEAKIQEAEHHKLLTRIQKRFSNVKLQANLLMRRKAKVREELEIHLDIINASTRPISMLKVKKIIPAENFKVTALPSHWFIKKGDLGREQMEIGAFEVEIINFKVQASKAGVFTFSPQVIYIDTEGETRTCHVKPITITVQPEFSITIEEEASTPISKIKFESEAAQKAFDYLVKAFVDDNFQGRLPEERCGWRTLNQIVKQAKISQYSMYKSKGRTGLALNELKKLGLIEIRIFVGERGRGGKIKKVRVLRDKENVRKYIEQQR